MASSRAAPLPTVAEQKQRSVIWRAAFIADDVVPVRRIGTLFVRPGPQSLPIDLISVLRAAACTLSACRQVVLCQVVEAFAALRARILHLGPHVDAGGMEEVVTAVDEAQACLMPTSEHSTTIRLSAIAGAWCLGAQF